jgi:hypothetical protein
MQMIETARYINKKPAQCAGLLFDRKSENQPDLNFEGDASQQSLKAAAISCGDSMNLFTYLILSLGKIKKAYLQGHQSGQASLKMSSGAMGHDSSTELLVYFRSPPNRPAKPPAFDTLVSLTLSLDCRNGNNAPFP